MLVVQFENGVTRYCERMRKCVVFKDIFHLGTHKHNYAEIHTHYLKLHKGKNIHQILVFKFLELGLLASGL